jgi:hypothetical protein
MLSTYKAIVSNDRLEWLEEKPRNLAKNRSFLVHVTILDKEINNEKEGKDSRQESLTDFFRRSPLYDSGILLEREKDYGREVQF